MKAASFFRSGALRAVRPGQPARPSAPSAVPREWLLSSSPSFWIFAGNSRSPGSLAQTDGGDNEGDVISPLHEDGQCFFWQIG